MNNLSTTLFKALKLLNCHFNNNNNNNNNNNDNNNDKSISHKM